MWKIFDNIPEKTFVLYKEKLVYANISALEFLNSYQVSLINKDIYDLFDNETVNNLKPKLDENEEFGISLCFKGFKPIKCKVKTYPEEEEKYIIIQEIIKNKKQRENDFIKIMVPETIYDPLRIGKASIINYELVDPYMKISGLIKETIENPDNISKLKEASDLLDSFYAKTKTSINELADFDEKYGLLKSEFGVSDLISRIAKRMNNYFLLEDINAEIKFTAIKKHDAVVCCDYMKIANSIITIISLLIDILSKKRKKAVVELEVIKEDKYCYIKILAPDVVINNTVYNEIIRKNKDIINLSRYKENRITMNIHIAGSYIELNGGELFIKRDKESGTTVSIKIPLVKTRYFLGENNVISEEEIDKIIKNKMFGIKTNV